MSPSATSAHPERRIRAASAARQRKGIAMIKTTRSAFRSRVAVSAAAVSALLLAAACGGSSGGDGATEPVANTGSADTAGGAGVDAAKADIAKLTGPITWPEPAKLAKTPDLTGKTVWFVPIGDAVPVIHAIGVGLTQGVEKAGGKVHLCDGKFQPPVIAGCLKSAAEQGADAVVSGFVDYAMLPTAFDAVVAKGIPVLVGGVAPSGGKQSDAKLSFYDPTARTKAIFSTISQAAVADQGASTNVLWVRLLDSSTTTASSDEGIATFKTACPTCKVATVDMTTPNLGKVGSAVSAALVSHPDTNALIVPIDTFVPAALAGVKSAGYSGKVKVYSSSGDLAGLQRVKAGEQAADVGTSPIHTGWGFAHALMQQLTGETVTPDTGASMRVFTKDNVGEAELTPETYLTPAWYGDDSFKQLYADAWGVK
jgi:ribose transport system substrate-binding protein